MNSLKYARYLLKHKWFVFIAGCRLGVSPYRLLIHDWSKLTPAEWPQYARSFYGQQPRSDEVKADFERAWLHHQHKNPHHWQHWVLREDSGATKTVPMPDKFLLEMLADWYGAGRTQTGKWQAHLWYENNKDKLVLHPETRARVEMLLGLAELIFNV